MLGKFITIEGIEAAGKSTQIQLIAEFLKQKNQPFILTREPGGTTTGEKIRNILLDTDTQNLDPETELLLMFAARNQHIQEKIIPALNNGIWVISDRFINSSYAYQGGGRGIDFARIQQLEKFVLQDFSADLSLFLNIDITTSRARMHMRGTSDRFEKEDDIFFTKVYEAFQQRITQSQLTIKNIDASGTIEQTFANIRIHLEAL